MGYGNLERAMRRYIRRKRLALLLGETAGFNPLVLAGHTCPLCFSTGDAGNQRTPHKVCACVYRQVFDIVLGEYLRFEALKEGGRARYSQIDFTVDFRWLAKRALEERLFPVFQLPFLEGRDWRTCCQLLHRTDGRGIFHDFYRVKERVGRACVETKPYGLFPCDEYPQQDLPKYMTHYRRKPQ